MGQQCYKLAALVISLLLTGVVPLNPGPILAASPDTVVFGMAQEPDTLIGQFSLMAAAFDVLSSLFVDMVELDEKAKPRPRRVEKIPTLKDGAEELPSIPLYFRVALVTSKKSLKNVRPSPFTINVNSELWE